MFGSDSSVASTAIASKTPPAHPRGVFSRAALVGVLMVVCLALTGALVFALAASGGYATRVSAAGSVVAAGGAPSVFADPIADTVYLQSWPATAEVVVSQSAAPAWSETLTVDASGNLTADLSGMHDIKSAALLTATDGADTKVLFIDAFLRVAAAVPGTATIAGPVNIAPGSPVELTITNGVSSLTTTTVAYAGFPTSAYRFDLSGSWTIGPSDSGHVTVPNGVGDGTRIAFGASSPRFTVDPSKREVSVFGQGRLADVVLAADTDANAGNGYATIAPITIAADGTGQYTYTPISIDGYFYLHVISESGAKTLALARDIQLVHADMPSQTVTGVATPDATLTVTPNSGWPSIVTTADATGDWSVQFPQWAFAFNGGELAATMEDDDRDALVSAYDLNAQQLWVDRSNADVTVSGFPAFERVVVTSYADEATDAVVGATVVETDMYGTGIGRLHTVDVLPGRHVVARGLTTPYWEDTVVADVTLTATAGSSIVTGSLDRDGEMLAATVGEEPYVGLAFTEWVEPGLGAPTPVPWSLDLSWTDYTVQAGDDVAARYVDWNGNQTIAWFHVPLPRLWADPTTGEAAAEEWAAGAELGVMVDADGDPGTPDATFDGTVTTGADGNAILDVGAVPGWPGVEAGQVLVVSDGVITRTLQVRDLRVTQPAAGAEEVTGSLTGTGVVATWLEGVSASHASTEPASGVWTADFSWRPIALGDSGVAQVPDTDGDMTRVSWHVRKPRLVADITRDQVLLEDWVPGSDVHVLVTEGFDPVYTVVDTTVTIDAGGSGVASGGDIRQGNSVTASDGETTKTHSTMYITLESVDTTRNVIGGTGMPVTLPMIAWLDGVQDSVRGLVVGMDNTWSIDWSYYKDIGEGDSGAVEFNAEAAGDNDATRLSWRIQTIPDTFAPVTFAHGLPSATDWYRFPLDVTFTADDTGGSGVAGTYFKLGSTGVTQTAPPCRVETEGVTTLYYWSEDASGNVEPAKTATIQLDFTPPTTTSDAKPWYMHSATISLTATDALSGVGSTYWALDESGWTTGTVVTTSQLGRHTLRYFSRDAVYGQEVTREESFTVESSASVTWRMQPTTEGHSRIWLAGWSPGETVTVEAHSGSPFGPLLYYWTMKTMGTGEWWTSVEAPNVTPGMWIVAWGDVSKTKTLFLDPALTAGSVDATTDVVSGTAPADVDVKVLLTTGPDTEVSTATPAGPGGSWSADLTDLGDIVPGAWGAASITDPQGDSFQVPWHLPARRIYADPDSDYAGVLDWPSAANVRVLCDMDGVPDSGDEYGGFWQDIDAGGDMVLPVGSDLPPGYYVHASSGGLTRTLYVDPAATFAAADPESDVATGTCPAGWTVRVANGAGYFFDATVTGGTWSVTFGGKPGGLEPGDSLEAWFTSPDGDIVARRLRIPAPAVLVNATSDEMSAWDWPANVDVLLTFYDSADTYMGQAVLRTDGSGNAYDWDQLDIRPDWHLSATAGGVLHMKLLDLNGAPVVQSMDCTTNVISGTAPVGAPVAVSIVEGADYYYASAVATDGTWAIDLDDAGYDLEPGSFGTVSAADLDGDKAAVSWYVPNPRIDAFPVSDELSAFGFPAGADLEFSLDDGTADPQPVWHSHVTADQWGQADVDLSPLEIEGCTVTVTDGTSTKTLAVDPALRIGAFSAADDLLTGLASPGATVAVTFDDYPSAITSMTTAGEPDGAWSVAFTGYHDVVFNEYAKASITDGDGDRTLVLAQLARPTVSACIDQDKVWTEGWFAGTNVTLAVDADADYGNGVLDHVAVTADEFGACDTADLDLASGRYLHATNGTLTKTLLLDDRLAVVSVDLESRVVTGTAPTTATVTVHADDSAWAPEKDVTPVSGSWVATFAAGDLVAGNKLRAEQPDEDGDVLVGFYATYDPHIQVSLTENHYVMGEGWPELKPYTCIVYDGPETLQEIRRFTGNSEVWGYIFAGARDFEAKPGMFVRLTSGSYEQTMTIAGMTIAVDAATDIASGSIDTTGDLEVSISGMGTTEFPAATPGPWSVDCGAEGVDIGPGKGATAALFDDDGDLTMVSVRLPDPYLQVDPSGSIVLQDWPTNSSVRLIVDRDGDPDTTGDAVYSGDIPTTDAMSTWLSVGTELPMMKLEPGMYVTASCGDTVRQLRIAGLTVTRPPLGALVVTGTADPGTLVEHSTSRSSATTEPVGGVWTIDLSSDGPVTYGSSGRAQVFDEDGDLTQVSWYVGMPTITAFPQADAIELSGWSPTATIDVVIDADGDPLTLVDNVLTRSVTPNRFGSARMGPGGFSLEPGQYVTASDGTITKQHLVLDVTVETPTGQVVRGTAPPGSYLVAFILRDDASYRELPIDETGQYSVDYTGSETVILPGDQGLVFRVDGDDDDGDMSAAGWEAASAHIWADPGRDALGLVGFTPNTLYTIEYGPWPPYYSVQVTTDAQGKGEVVGLGGRDLAPGWTVRCDGPTGQRTLLVETLTAQADERTDLLDGTAAAGRTVAIDYDSGSEIFNLVAGPTGIWQADFGYLFGTDLTLGKGGLTTVKDGDGDETRAAWTVTAATLDLSAPVTTVSGISHTWVRGPVTASLEATDGPFGSGVAATYWLLASEPTTQTYTLPAVLTPEGATTFYYWSVDASGNVEAPKSSVVRIDNTPPTSACAPRQTYTGTANVSITATDALSGPGDSVWRWDFAGEWTTGTVATTDTMGPHVLEYYSVDAVGNVETPAKQHSITVIAADSIAPTTTASGLPPVGSWATTNVVVTLTAEDNPLGAGVAAIHFKRDAEATQTYPASPCVISKEGTTTLRYWAVDDATPVGNVEVPQVATVLVDKTAPVTSASGNTTYTGDATITLSVAEAHSGVALTRWSVDGGAWQDGTVATATILGPHTLRFYSVDVAGNAETVKSKEIVLLPPDAVPPVTTLGAYPTAWARQDVEVTMTATDAGAGVAHTYFRRGLGSSAEEYPPCLITAEGTTTLYYWSVDWATPQNAEAERSITVRIDKTAPTTSYTGAATIPAGSKISLAEHDEVSGIAVTRYSIDGAPERVYTGPFDFPLGRHELTFYSVDVAGNGQSPVVFAITSGAVTPPVTERAQTSLTIRSSATSVVRGRAFVLSGVLTPAAVGDPVVVYVKRPGKAYWSYSSKRLCYRAAAGGGAEWWYRYTTVARLPRGYYLFKAGFGGDAARLPVVSSTVTVRVR